MRVVIGIAARIIHTPCDIGVASYIHILVKAGVPGEGKTAGASHFALLGRSEIQASACAAHGHVSF